MASTPYDVGESREMVEAQEAMKKKSKVPNNGYKVPKWFKSIKPGAHGSTPSQKRVWRVVSETYKKQDWEKHGHYCPLCTRHIPDWKTGNLSHFKRYSLCNSFFKYSRINTCLTCAGCNLLDDGPMYVALAFVLQQRHGEDVLEQIDTQNGTFRGQKMQEWELVDYVARLRPDLVI